MQASAKEKQQTDDIEINIDVMAEKDSSSKKTKSSLLPPAKKRQRAKPVEVVKKESKNASKDKKGNVLNVKEIRLSFARMVIIDELPFKFVEGEGFKAYSRALELSFEVPSRHTVARDCMKIFIEEKRKLKKLFKSERVCLTTDTWTSLQNLNYMCHTAHWIDSDWELQKRIINFCIVENHKGETIEKQIEECLYKWEIDKVCTITVDNASSNVKAIAHLKKKCKWKDVILNNDYMHMRCSAHIANLIVKEGLEEQHESIMHVRNAVKYVRSSPARLKALKRCVEKEKIDSKSLLCLDVETRWNSTYLMLDAAEKFEKAFERLGDEEQKFIEYLIVMNPIKMNVRGRKAM
ncbi:UNVERIFIED_CONTAM: Zinc finger BED domain-containing protein RICESLEEPER 2 [Sesamum radiatum]|uniref:Zinc finger BED domain-containing protein RICESLEEPER 2 n=1 Tax=Sesamum radiatum TaxID=300843 RepID=A0AAW2KAG6_SESRA